MLNQELAQKNSEEWFINNFTIIDITYYYFYFLPFPLVYLPVNNNYSTRIISM